VVDMTGAGAVSHNGKVISGANPAIITGRLIMTMTDMAGSVMAGTATICNRFTVPTNVWQVNVGAIYGNLFFDTFKFRCKTKIGMNEKKKSEHDM